jgi:hypothetical protein
MRGGEGRTSCDGRWGANSAGRELSKNAAPRTKWDISLPGYRNVKRAVLPTQRYGGASMPVAAQ